MSRLSNTEKESDSKAETSNDLKKCQQPSDLLLEFQNLSLCL